MLPLPGTAAQALEGPHAPVGAGGGIPGSKIGSGVLGAQPQVPHPARRGDAQQHPAAAGSLALAVLEI